MNAFFRRTQASFVLALLLLASPAAAQHGGHLDKDGDGVPDALQEETEAKLDPKAVRKAFDDRRAEVDRCLALQEDAGDDDRVVVRFTVDETGKVVEQKIGKSTMDDAVEACLLELVAGVTIEVPEGIKKVEAEFPFRPRPKKLFLGSEAEDALFADYRERMGACWQDAVDAGNESEGEVELSWVIQPDGSVTAVELDESSLGDEVVEDCILEVARGMKLREREAEQPVTFTWKFSLDDWKIRTFGEGSGKPWIVNVNFGTRTNMMPLHPTEYVRDSASTVMTSLAISGSYRLAHGLMAGIAFGGAYELTTPGDPNGRRFWPSDPSISLNHGSLYKDEDLTGLNVSGALSASIGLSPGSLWRTQLGTLGAGLSAGRSWLDGSLNASISLGGTRFVHRYTSPVGEKRADDGVMMIIARSGGAEDVAEDLAAMAGTNPAWSANVGLNVGYQVSDKLMTGVGFGLGRTWTYTPELDEFSAPIVDSNGNQVVDCGGLCPMDMMTGNIMASYRIDSRFSISAMLMTGGSVFGYRRVDPQDPQADLTEDPRVLRFPWWDKNLQATSLGLSLSAAL